MNIVEAYIKFKPGLIILISGMTGSHISRLGKNLSKDINIAVLSYANFCKEGYNNRVRLPNGTEIINWDSDETIDWDRLNAQVKIAREKGVIVFAPAFPIDKLDQDIQIDAHIHIKLAKQNLLAKRQSYIQKHPEECKDLFGRDPGMELQIFNKYTFPYYLQSLERSKVTKFINANEFSNESDEVYDERLANEAFSYLMSFINRWLEQYHKSSSSPSPSPAGSYQQPSQAGKYKPKFGPKGKQDEEDDLEDEEFDLDEEPAMII